MFKSIILDFVFNGEIQAINNIIIIVISISQDKTDTNNGAAVFKF